MKNKMFGRNKQMIINSAIDYIETQKLKIFNSRMEENITSKDMLYFY